MRSGFVAVVGRPNVGKSTLINTIIGEKVTITSSRPNTTRHQIRGVLTRPDAQIIFVDTPGIHRPKTRLGERLNESALAAVEGVEVLIPIIEAGESIGPGDRNVLSRSIAAAASTEGPRLIVAVNKIDRAGPNRTAQQLLAAMAEIEKIADAQGDRARAAVAKAELFPISAKTGRGVEALLSRVADLLEEGPQYYPSEMLSDQSEPSHIAELVREQLLSRTRDELPHAIFCRVSEWEDNRVTVEILVERDS